MRKNDYIQWLRSVPPLRVENVKGVSEYIFWIGGNEWHFLSEAPSRIVDGEGRIVLGSADLWDHDACAKVFERLIGLDVIEIDCSDISPEGDMRLEFSNKMRLENFDTYFADSWALVVDGKEAPEASPVGLDVHDPRPDCGVSPVKMPTDIWVPFGSASRDVGRGPFSRVAIEEVRNRPARTACNTYGTPSRFAHDIEDPYLPHYLEWVSESWTLSSTTPWRLFDERGFPVASSDWRSGEVKDRVAGLAPTQFNTLDDRMLDLAVLFHNGWKLELFTDGCSSTWNLTTPVSKLSGLP